MMPFWVGFGLGLFLCPVLFVVLMGVGAWLYGKWDQ